MLSTRLRQIMANLGHEVAARPNPHGEPHAARPQSHYLGADLVAILLVCELLAESGAYCLTSQTVHLYAGQSRGTVGGKLVKLADRKWLDQLGTECPLGTCTKGSKHYRPTPQPHRAGRYLTH